jgi:alkanesulfonate monooxygenase
VSGRCPPFYFGGHSPDALDAAAYGADVYLMWPDTLDRIAKNIADVKGRAAAYGRSLKIGYRAHVIVRDTEAQARAAAERLISRVDPATGEAIRAKALDSQSVGVRRQAELRQQSADDGFIEENLWTGIGRARSGAGAAIVGDPDQVLAKIEAYKALGIEAFIFSGYPSTGELDLFGRHVLPRLNHGPLLT